MSEIAVKEYSSSFTIAVTPENRAELDRWRKWAARARWKREHRLNRMLRRAFTRSA